MEDDECVPRAEGPRTAVALSAYRRGSPEGLEPSGEVDGWRWWVVRDADGCLLTCDNRPVLAARDYASVQERESVEVVALIQATIPLAVALAAFVPRRDDAVAGWLRARRDEHPPGTPQRAAVDLLLDDYRLHADTGTPLGREAGGPSAVDLGPAWTPVYRRASGTTTCGFVIGGADYENDPPTECGREYREHASTEFGGAPGVSGLILHELCDGTWVKL